MRRGGMPERPNGTVLKTVEATSPVGSNPTPSAPSELCDDLPMNGLPLPTGPHAGRANLDPVHRPERRGERYSGRSRARRSLCCGSGTVPPKRRPRRIAGLLPPAAWASTGEFLGIDRPGTRSHAVADARLLDGDTRFPVLLLSPTGFPPLFLSAPRRELRCGQRGGRRQPHVPDPVTAFPDGEVVPLDPCTLAVRCRAQCRRPRAGLRRAGCSLRVQGRRPPVRRRQARAPRSLPSGLAADRLDLTRLAALGHSMGGNTALSGVVPTPDAAPR